MTRLCCFSCSYQANSNISAATFEDRKQVVLQDHSQSLLRPWLPLPKYSLHFLCRRHHSFFYSSQLHYPGNHHEQQSINVSKTSV